MKPERRLLDYIDEMAPPVTTQEAIARRQSPDRSGRGLAWALAAFAVVLIVGGLYFAFRGADGQIVDQTTVPTPTTVPAPEPAPPSFVKWPQSSLEEVQEAQELADAGDPDYTWQLEPNMESILWSNTQVDTPEIFARFLREELGWEEFALTPGSSGTIEGSGILAVGAVLIRCEPGKSNPLWPNDPRFGGCAPTIDDFHYETVDIFVAQPGKRGPEGIWVISAQSEVDPLVQIAPITEVEVAAIVDAFLQARIAGEGAEQYLGSRDDLAHFRNGLQHFETPFLYATSTGAPYERAEFEIVDDEQWPGGGWIHLKVRLFAEGGQTVMEQTFTLEGERLYRHQDDQSTENGQPLPKNSGVLGGEVTSQATPSVGR